MVKSMDQRKKQRLAFKRETAAQQIYFAAARAINNNHSSIPGMEQIARELGGSRGILYYYFNSKGELLHKMQVYLHDQIAGVLDPIGEDASLPPRKKLEKVIRGYSTVVLENYDLVRALWTDASMYEQPARLRARIMIRVSKFYRRLEEIIDEACKSENLKCPDSRVAARLIMALPDSVCRWYEPDRGLTADQITDYLVQSVFRGFFTGA